MKGRFLVKISGIIEVTEVPTRMKEGENKLRTIPDWERRDYIRRELKKMQEEGLFDLLFDVDIQDYMLLEEK